MVKASALLLAGSVGLLIALLLLMLTIGVCQAVFDLDSAEREFERLDDSVNGIDEELECSRLLRYVERARRDGMQDSEIVERLNNDAIKETA